MSGTQHGASYFPWLKWSNQKFPTYNASNNFEDFIGVNLIISSAYLCNLCAQETIKKMKQQIQQI